MFTVPDFYEKGQFNLDWIGFMKLYPDKFVDQSISSVYGSFPLMIWAGGRQNKVDGINFVSLKDVRIIAQRFNQAGVGIVLTCTNSLITEKHLGDYYCNAVLEILAEHWMNAVLVNSSVLEEYIRNKYSNLGIYRSTTACDIELPTERYDRVVADFHWNNSDKVGLIPKGQREKVEIMLNDTCPPYCPYRKTHYWHISQYNLHGGQSRIEPMPTWNCQCPEFKTSFYKNLENPATIKPETMNKYRSMGFKHFKIVGREFNPVQLAEIYTYYMVKPEYQAEIMSWAIYRFSNVTGGDYAKV